MLLLNESAKILGRFLATGTSPATLPPGSFRSWTFYLANEFSISVEIGPNSLPLSDRQAVRQVEAVRGNGERREGDARQM